MGLKKANSTSFKKGNIPWNKNMSCPEKTRLKISKKLLGHKNNTVDVRLKISNKLRGIKRPPRTKEHINKLRLANLGIKHSYERIKKRIEGRRKNGKEWMTAETRKKISLANGGDGLHFTRNYPTPFNKIKAKIRKRDNYTCQLCFVKWDRISKQFPVHHIDHNINNNNSTNLVCLCQRCNIKVNSSKVRSFWIQFFKDRFNTSLSSICSVYLCGKAGSGKTSCAEYLIKRGYQVAKFAAPVYMIAEKYFNMKSKDRKLLQIIGTDIGRRYDSDIWINRFLIDMRIVKLTKYLLKMPDIPFVCDDVRFKNEHKKLKKEGWIGIYLDVSDDIRINRLKNRDGDAKIECLTHKSETEIDSFKDNLIKLDASGSIEDTINKLKIILNIKD
jgi:hypothetical protein